MQPLGDLMQDRKDSAMATTISRRKLLVAAAGWTVAAGAALAQSTEPDVTATVRNNVSGFRMQDWRDHFETLGLSLIHI